jgi:hypothetical protein
MRGAAVIGSADVGEGDRMARRIISRREIDIVGFMMFARSMKFLKHSSTQVSESDKISDILH